MTQASLLMSRGDFAKAKLCFQAELPDVAVAAKSRASPTARLGMRLRTAAAEQMGLTVRNIANEHRDYDTPAVQWNMERRRQQGHALFEVRPGDRIRAVNAEKTCAGMLRELISSTSPTSSRAVCLQVERDLGDVMELSRTQRQDPTASLLRSPAQGHRRMAKACRDHSFEAPLGRLEEFEGDCVRSSFASRCGSRGSCGEHISSVSTRVPSPDEGVGGATSALPSGVSLSGFSFRLAESIVDGAAGAMQQRRRSSSIG